MKYQKDDFIDRIDTIDKYWSETIEEMQVKLEDVRVMARDHVTNKAKDMTDDVTK